MNLEQERFSIDESSATSSTNVTIIPRKSEIPIIAEQNILSSSISLNKIDEISTAVDYENRKSPTIENKVSLLTSGHYANLVSALGKNSKTPTATDFEKLIEVNRKQVCSNIFIDNEQSMESKMSDCSKMEIDENLSDSNRDEKSVSDTEFNPGSNENITDDCMWRPW